MKLVSLGSVAEVIAGQSPEGIYYNSEGTGTPFYQGKKEFGDKFLGVPTTWTTKITKLAQSGDILMSVRAPVGPINFSTQQICIGRGLAAIRASELVDKEFLFYFLLYKQPEISGNTGAVFDSINKDQIASIHIPLPTLEKQREVVEKLDLAFSEIDSLHVKQKESAKFVNTMLQSYIDDLLLRDRDESVPLTNLAILENGDRGSNYPNKNMREETGVPFINAGHIGEGKLDMSQMDYIAKGTFDKLSRGKIQRNDLLFCLRGSLGKTAILSDLDEGAIASSLVIVRAKDGVNPKFLLYYFLSSICKSEIEEFRSGTAQPNLGGSDLKKFSVPLHSQTRMQEIVTKIDEVASQIEILTKNNILRSVALVELKQSILNSVFTFEEEVA